MLIRFESLCREIRISRPVRILESALVQAPIVVGWLHPVILLPASALTGLTPHQLETILFHELAHIRRYDYLVNLLQTAVEILLFYHPAVWWVSRRTRIERENCCDDWAVERCGDRIAYARALTELETLRQITPHFAMAAGGGSLLKRIQRIVGSQSQRQSGSWTAGLIALAMVGILAAGAKIPIFPDDEVTTRRAVAQSNKLGFIAGLASVGYTNLTVDELISLKDHGVTPEFVRGIQAAGFAHPGPEELIRTKDHGVDPEFIRRVHSLGYEKLELDEFIRMKDHGVDPAYIEGIRNSGFSNVSIDQMIRLRDYDVDAGFIQKAKSNGLKNLSIDQLIRLRDADIFDESSFGGKAI